MKENNYDIFISYRRDGGAQYARILQLLLIQRGYRAFLDYDELVDGFFSENIRAAIKAAPVFMLVLSKGSMQRCANDGDWVRQEIMMAIGQRKHIIPVNPDNMFDGFPEGVPDDIVNHVGSSQFSDISFGQALGATVDLLIKTRLAPTLGERMPKGHRDENFDAARESLRRQEAHNRFMRRLGIAAVTLVVAIALGTSLWVFRSERQKAAQAAQVAALAGMRSQIEEKHKDFLLVLNDDLTAGQMAVIDTILTNMTMVYPDSVWMSQFEFTVGQWHTILGQPFDETQRALPMTGVSFGDIYMLLGTLGDMTKLMVELPDADLWEYAAHGGQSHEASLYAGNDDVDRVAWYKDNSGGQAHPSDGQQGLEPNMLDLYDMSGNVGELCNSHFDASGLYTVCGGSYDSPASEVTVASRRGIDTNAKDKTVGFRIIIRKP